MADKTPKIYQPEMIPILTLSELSQKVTRSLETPPHFSLAALTQLSGTGGIENVLSSLI